MRSQFLFVTLYISFSSNTFMKRYHMMTQPAVT